MTVTFFHPGFCRPHLFLYRLAVFAWIIYYAIMQGQLRTCAHHAHNHVTCYLCQNLLMQLFI